MSKFSLAIVGGGPNALYCIERLLAHTEKSPALAELLSIHVYDPQGNFGAGCHYPDQPVTNHLNRIASQISFGADESNRDQVSALLPEHRRETLFSWCMKQYAATKNERYNVSEREWVDRGLFGEASCDVFKQYIAALNAHGVKVELVRDRVTGVQKKGEEYLLSLENGGLPARHAAIMLCTGHPTSEQSQASRKNSANGEANYVHSVYPIERIDADVIKPGETAICKGMGLAAIDVILRLTEGRGGYFVPTGDAVKPLRYVRSGFEPEQVFAYSSTGVFLFARAYNEKLNDPDLFETGHYFTPDLIDRLRQSVGIAAHDPRGGEVRQLDFGRFVLPVMVLEMQRIYYQTLFGKPEFEKIRSEVDMLVDWFADGGAQSFDSINAALHGLSEPVERYFTELAGRLSRALDGSEDLAETDVQALISFVRVYSGQRVQEGEPLAVLGEARAILAKPSPFLHEPCPIRHVFKWTALIEPLKNFRDAPRESLRQSAYSAFLKDLAEATQGNISNPRKAAIDGVWRDMRDTVRYCVEFGALLPDSQKFFMNTVHRITNRIAVGTSLKMMTKIMALVDAGILDLSFGLAPDLEETPDGFQLSRNGGSESIRGQVLFNASVHKFDLARTEDPLYRSLAGNGLVREWVVSSTDGGQFATGGVEVDRQTNLVVGVDGLVNPRIGLLGTPSEGPLYFHLAAVRPYCADPVIVDADKAISALLQNLQEDLPQFGDLEFAGVSTKDKELRP